MSENDSGRTVAAIANNVTLQAMARIAMAFGTPVVTGVLCALAWFAQGIIDESRKTREAFNDYRLQSSVNQANTEGRVKILERRVDTTDSELLRLRDWVYRAQPSASTPPR